MSNNNIINVLPRIPDPIIEAVNNKRLVLFIGAGVSRINGCKGWNELALNLLKKCRDSENKKGEKYLTYKEYERLSKDHDHKKIITICYRLLSNDDNKGKFYEEFGKSLIGKPDDIEKYPIYKQLSLFKAINITTNADNLYDGYFAERNILKEPAEYDNSFDEEDECKNRYLYKIHGHWGKECEETLIFTVDQYINRYNKVIFQHFLNKIFTSGYTVLFVGYGLSEFELIDYLITKSNLPKSDKKQIKHYMLKNYFTGEENILEMDKLYYNDLSIDIIPYAIDNNGYKQLYYVIEDFVRQIREKSNALLNESEVLESLVDKISKKPTDKDVDKLLSIIQNDPTQEKYLFALLEKNQNPFVFLESLYNKKYFEPVHNPSPQVVSVIKGRKSYMVPRWNVLDYLLNCAKYLSENESLSEEDKNLFLKIVENIAFFKNGKKQRIQNDRTDWYLIKIFFVLPDSCIKREYIGFIRTALKSRWDSMLISREIYESIFPKMLSMGNEQFLNNFISAFLTYKRVDNGYTVDYLSLVENYQFNKTLEKHKNKLCQFSSKELVNTVIKKINQIIKRDYGQFNEIWIKAIEDKPDPHFNERYESQIIFLLRDLVNALDDHNKTRLIIKFLSNDHEIFKRLAIYLIDVNYEKNKELFWNFDGNPLNISPAKHEIYKLINRNSSKFTECETDKLITWIEDKDYYIPKEFSKEKVVRYLALKKKEWITNLPEDASPKLKELYHKYHKINDYISEYPGYNYYSGPAQVTMGFESPLTNEEVAQKTPLELKEFIISFKKNDAFNGPSKEGLSEIIKMVIAKNPDKYTESIHLFYDVEYVYQYALINGFYKAAQEKKDFNTEAVLEFSIHIIKQSDFWKNEKTGCFHNYKKWIVSAVTDFIEKRAQNDKIEADSFNDIKWILFKFIEHTESIVKDNKNIVSQFLNSTRGRVWGTLVIVSLWQLRINGLNRGTWDKSIQNIFDKYLNEIGEESFEFYGALGLYFNNLVYLNRQWVEHNIKKIFPKRKTELWEATFKSYLLSSGTRYFEVYDLLNKSNQYEFALKRHFDDHDVNDKLVQHICIAYFKDEENINDPKSLISKLIDTNDIDKLNSILRIFRVNKDYLLKTKQHKVKPVWERLYQKCKDNINNSEYQKLAKNLVSWLKVITVIDKDIYKWLDFSVCYLNDSSFSSFSENLMLHIEKTPQYTGKLLLQAIKHGFLPTFEENEIKAIVEKTFKVDKETAIQICNIYYENGIRFLKNIHKKYQSKI